MPIGDWQRERRRKYLGSSDAPAICGVSPWATPADVYLSKTAQLDELPATEDMERGNFLEEALLRFFEAKNPARIRRNQFRAAGFRCANLDAVTETGEVVECKTSTAAAEWGPDEEHIPDHVAVQCHHQMLVTEARLVHIPALIFGYRPVLKIFRCPWNEKLSQAVASAEERFWREHIEKGIPPAGSLPSIEMLRLLKREPAKRVSVSADLVLAWRDSRERLKLARQAADKAEAGLLAAMGDAEAGDSEAGTVTYFEQKRKGYAVEACAFRVLRFKGE